MKTPHFHLARYLILFIIVAIAGFQTASAVSIAVLPFTSEKSKKGENPSLRSFEKLYYSYRLIDALNHCSGVKAYFSPAKTPSTDVCVQGHINESNGRKTSVTLTRFYPDGRKIDDDDYSVMISSKDFIKQHDPAGKLWQDAAKNLVKQAQAMKENETDARRVFGYAEVQGGDVDKPAQPHNLEIVKLASSIEIERVLEPMTVKVVEDGKKLDSWYINWQATATPLVEQRSHDKVNAFWGGVAMVMGAAAGGFSSYEGYSNPGATGVVASGAYAVDTSNHDIQQVNVTLNEMQDAMSYGQGHEITFTFYDQVYHLSGNSSDQLGQFHKIVSVKLRQAPSA